MSFLDVFILALIEGLTEFLPVSSTGHIILMSAVLKLQTSEFQKAFDVVIQFGAILAVVYLYRDQFKWNFDFYKRLALAFIPAGAIGFLLRNHVAIMMESTSIIAWALIAGGIIMILVDRFLKQGSISFLTDRSALLIGLFQCLALVPGVSRSGATIVGAQLLGITKEKAAEFSFLLAVPTITAASLYKLLKVHHLITFENGLHLIVGIVLSFFFAILPIRFFIHIVKKFGFFWFGVYRIILGALVLVLLK